MSHQILKPVPLFGVSEVVTLTGGVSVTYECAVFWGAAACRLPVRSLSVCGGVSCVCHVTHRPQDRTVSVNREWPDFPSPQGALFTLCQPACVCGLTGRGVTQSAVQTGRLCSCWDVLLSGPALGGWYGTGTKVFSSTQALHLCPAARLIRTMGLWTVYVCAALALICSAQASYSYHSVRCDCRGRSQYCLRDAWGLRCVDCQGNTEGRHCERCKVGFYLQENQRSCTACVCHQQGSKVGADGCTRSRQLREDSGSWSPSCFCFGHSSECSVQPGFYVYNISSTFSDGLDGWRAATPDGQTPRNVYFRWSPRHQDVEVISSNIQPVYLYAPARFLGDQLNSYGQNLSFFLRLDRGLRHPSIGDVILEGAGLSVSTSLGDLRHSVACGRKQYYSFRLDERSFSPQLSSFSFQTLLQNLTAIKIRATFGHSGRGYLDTVSLVSARPSPGTVPAGWVRSCTCPSVWRGSSVSAVHPGSGARSPAEEPTATNCANGYTGPTCTDCAEGFYRETVRGDGFPAPCQACACDQQGALSSQCDDSGTCFCKPGFEGQKCSAPKCPSCFSSVIARLEQFALKVRELETYFSGPGLGPGQTEAMEAALRSARRQLEELQEDLELASDGEKRLEKRLTSLTSDRDTLGQDLDKLSLSSRDVQNRQQTYRNQVDTVEELIADMTGLLKQAQSKLQSVELPQADSPSDEPTNPFSSLLQKALDCCSRTREKKVQENTEDLQSMIDKISASVKELESQAPQVSSDAKTQSETANAMIQDLLNLEKKLPTTLQPEVDNLMSRLDAVKANANKNLADLDKVKAAMEQEQKSVKDLMDKGKAAQETFDKLVTRVDQAKSDTEDALRRIQSNTDQLDDSLDTLKGFEQQMEQAKALADSAIGRLPTINSTVQSAKRDNAATQELVSDVSELLDQAGQGRDQLKEAVDGLQDKWSSVPQTSGLLEQASLLRAQADQLQTDSTSTAADVGKELEQARVLEQEAAQGAEDAQAALENTQKSRDAVRRTLRDVQNFINSLNGSEPLDLSRLEQLESSLGSAQRDINLDLVPRLEQLQQKEQAHRRYLQSLDRDLSTILQDIQNIEDILRSVPQGCYNNAPLEEP
ncbi:hypothetical protein WMY93_000145 [Mugilogobius chulae]|uniref:Laminin IV type A domain-containing protein n=1 Tax=Mugilogobius chulae TaxID=88201 RepID=A0AAW0Q1E2_9GOBI